MPFVSRKEAPVDPGPSTVAPTSGLPSSQVTQQLQLPTNSQSQSHLQSESPQEEQQSQPVYPWSAHAPPLRQSSSPFLRNGPALSTCATPAGELFLFGGFELKSRSRRNDLYMISTRDFSTTLLQTSGDVPNPRVGHRAVLTGTTLFISGGKMKNAQNQSNDNSLHQLDLTSRKWTRIVINGPGPGHRYLHTITLVGSKLVVFGGRSVKSRGSVNDTWALDLNCLKSNPSWESYDSYKPAPKRARNEKPLPRSGHVSVATGDRVIIFGGGCSSDYFNDTWSLNTSTREWTELQCTGSIPSPRVKHAAVLIDGIMYVFGGITSDGTHVGDLTALNLSTQRWTSFLDIRPSPCGRKGHAIAADGRRVFVLGGELEPGSQVDEAKPIHVLDTTLLIYPKPDSNTVKHSMKTTKLAQNLSTGHPTHDQPQQGAFSSSDAGATHGSFSTEHHAEPVAPDAPSKKEVVRLEDERHIELERQLSETLVAKTELDRRIVQLTEELALKSALLEQAAEEKKRAGLEQRVLQAKLGELLLSRDQAEANVVEAKERARLDQHELQAKLDKSLLSRDHALEQSQRELAEVYAKLEAGKSELAAFRLRVTDTEDSSAKRKSEADTRLHELQGKINELLLSRDHALEQVQNALQKASCATEANEQSQRKLAEVHAKLEVRESELAAFRLLLADTENSSAKSKAEADTYSNQNETGLVNTDEDLVVHGLMERAQAREAEMASLPRRWNEKSFEMMECRNEG